MMKNHPSPICAAILVLGFLGPLLLSPGAAWAFDAHDLRATQNRGGEGLVTPLVPRIPAPPARRGGGDRGQARDAVRRGEISPLEDVTARVLKRYPGRLLDARLHRSRGRWVYRLKMLTRDGRVLRLLVDARSARILGVAGPRSGRR